MQREQCSPIHEIYEAVRFFLVNQKLLWAAWFSESKTYGVRSSIPELIYLLSRFFLVIKIIQQL